MTRIEELNQRKDIYVQEGLPTVKQINPETIIHKAPIDSFMEALNKENPPQALRYNQGKLQWSLIDYKSLEGLVRVLEMGAQKYSRDNWKLGMPTSQVCESLMRHLFAFMSGEIYDKESGCSHMSHVLCNAMFIEYIMREKPQFYDQGNENQAI